MSQNGSKVLDLKMSDSG